MFYWEMIRQFLRSGKNRVGLSTLLSLLGMIIGVASLVVAMAVVSGYETTLKRTVIDAYGHILLMKRGAADNNDSWFEDVRDKIPEMSAASPLLYLEAILAHKGKLTGVLVEGVDPVEVKKVLRLHDRLVDGEFNFEKKDGVPGALIGKGLQSKYGLKLGDIVRIVMPVSKGYDSAQFRSEMMSFYVAGVLDFGRFDFDSRYVVMDLATAQAFAKVGARVTGYRIKLQHDDQAQAVSDRLNKELDSHFHARPWREVNHNLFEATKNEKAMIFLILSILVIAASFNISSTLFVTVVQRFHAISILKTLGASRLQVLKIFVGLGTLLGVIGAVFGVLVGLLLCQLFMWAQGPLNLIPKEIYKLTKLQVEVRPLDLLAIMGVSIFICFLSTLAPARTGSKLKPVEGLRYE